MSTARDDVFVLPTSLAQRRYWQLDQLLPGNPALNMPLAFRLSGPLDVPALDGALQGLAGRHEILRATLEKVGGEVAQIVRPEGRIPLDIVDLSGLPRGEREACIEKATLAEARKPFSLASGPLVRATLLRQSDLEHVLLVSLHHVVCDGWSNGILVRELAELYRAGVEGGPPRLAELPIQFADFASWQEEWLRGEKFDAAFDYWRGKLSGSLPALDLPTDRPRRPGRVAGRLESTLIEVPLRRAQAFGRQVDATPFMLFRAFAALSRSGPARKTSSSARPPRTGSTSRPRASSAPARASCSGSTPRRPDAPRLVLRVKELALSAFGFVELPFELIEWQETLKRVPYAPRVMFIYQSAFMQPAALPGGHARPLRSVSPGSA